MMLWMCRSTVPSVMQSRRPMPAFERPSAINWSTSRSRGRQLLERVTRRPRRVETLRPMSRRHANVHDRQIRPVLAHEPHELGPVARLTDDLVPTPLEEAGDALPHQHVIVGDDDSRAATDDLGHEGWSIPQRAESTGPRGV
jgi:hypothetical protein